jgi:hypothetical protein
MAKEERQVIVELAKRGNRGISEEVRRRVIATLGEEQFLDAIDANVAVKVLERRGWLECSDPRYGGAVLLPPGSAPPGPFVPIGVEVPMPQIVAEASIERTLRGVFEAWGIPVEQRTAIREGLFMTLTKHLPKRGEEEERTTSAPVLAERVSATSR